MARKDRFETVYDESVHHVIQRGVNKYLTSHTALTLYLRVLVEVNTPDKGKYSKDFDAYIHLKSIGVVNQTTMLASETQEIADLLKETMIRKYGIENISKHFADTRDTLCYATNDNQDATYGMLEVEADFAIVVGGYNSSNTTNIVEDM